LAFVLTLRVVREMEAAEAWPPFGLSETFCWSVVYALVCPAFLIGFWVRDLVMRGVLPDQGRAAFESRRSSKARWAFRKLMNCLRNKDPRVRAAVSASLHELTDQQLPESFQRWYRWYERNGQAIETLDPRHVREVYDTTIRELTQLRPKCRI